jgi:hypothetical protein
MNEVDGFDPADVQEIVTPEADDARIIREYIELLTDDDPGLNLESADSPQLERLRMRFIGWEHSNTYAPALFAQIKAYDPQLLIMESFGDTEASLKNKELIYNLMMFKVPTLVGLNGEYGEPTLGNDHEHEEIMRLIRDSAGLYPIYRKVDATAEQAALHGLSEIQQPYQLILNDMDWHLRPLPELKRDFAAAFNEEGRKIRTRESIMIEGVSRIAANALSRLDGDVRVMVCFGSTHTPVARHFQKLGIDSDLRFIDTETHGLGTAIRFSDYQSAVREANIRGQASPELIGGFMLKTLLQLKTSAGLEFRKQNQADRPARDFERIADSIIPEHGPEIWKRWGKLHSRLLMTRGMKEKAILTFEDMLDDLVYKALNQTDY